MAVANTIWLFLSLAFCFTDNVGAGFMRNVYHEDLRIINGNPVKISEVPFHAIIWNKKKQLAKCGASIVHEQFLVTAAHCIGSMIKNIKDYEIKVGTDNVHKGDEYEIEKSFMHPKFHMRTADYDVGVIKLKTKLKLSQTIQKISMADSSLVFKKGDVFDTLGYGITEKGTNSDILLKVDVPYIERAECATIEKRNVTDRMICAGNSGRNDYRGPCFGDSGGALRFKNNLLGIVSWSAIPLETPTVFAFIPVLRNFIDKTIKDNL